MSAPILNTEKMETMVKKKSSLGHSAVAKFQFLRFARTAPLDFGFRFCTVTWRSRICVVGGASL